MEFTRTYFLQIVMQCYVSMLSNFTGISHSKVYGCVFKAAVLGFMTFFILCVELVCLYFLHFDYYYSRQFTFDLI